MPTEDFVELIDLLLSKMPGPNNRHCQAVLFNMAMTGKLDPALFASLHDSWADRDWLGRHAKRKGTPA